MAAFARAFPAIDEGGIAIDFRLTPLARSCRTVCERSLAIELGFGTVARSRPAIMRRLAPVVGSLSPSQSGTVESSFRQPCAWRSVGKRGRLVSLLADIVTLLGAFVSLAGSQVTLVAGLVSPVAGVVSLVSGLIPPIGSLISLVAGLVSPVPSLVSLVGGNITPVSSLVSALASLVSALPGLVSAFAGLVSALAGLVSLARPRAGGRAHQPWPFTAEPMSTTRAPFRRSRPAEGSL